MSSLKDYANFKFHPNCAGIQLSHLAFADDIMLLSRGDIPSVSTMFAKRQHFCRVSGLSISSDKSAIYLAGIRPHELSHIQQLIGFSLGDFPFRYLGVPLLSSILNVELPLGTTNSVVTARGVWSKIEINSMTLHAEFPKELNQD